MGIITKELAAETNAKVRALWRAMAQSFPDATAREPLIVDPDDDQVDAKAGRILFVGMNPSFVTRDLAREFGKNENEIIQLFRFDPTRETREDLRPPIEKPGEHRYFKAFGSFLDDVPGGNSVSRAHRDIFYVRETKQARVKKWALAKESMTQFGRDQWEITWKLLEAVDPALIVVCNATASRIFKSETEAAGRLKWCAKTGCEILTLGREIPVFFSGMLSGQRALDVFNRKRMAWHLNFACKYLNIPLFP